jgi:nucleoside 2-deoxyribosyltransferase
MRPEVVTICGSMRFFESMLKVASILTNEGKIVLAPFTVVAAADQSSGPKVALDELHFRKIEMSDFIVVVTRGGYIGTSTNREIGYAESLGKAVNYFEDVAA